MQQVAALAAGYRGDIVRGDALHFRPVRGFLIARVAQDHAVRVKGV